MPPFLPQISIIPALYPLNHPPEIQCMLHQIVRNLKKIKPSHEQSATKFCFNQSLQHYKLLHNSAPSVVDLLHKIQQNAINHLYILQIPINQQFRLSNPLQILENLKKITIQSSQNLKTLDEIELVLLRMASPFLPRSALMAEHRFPHMSDYKSSPANGRCVRMRVPLTSSIYVFIRLKQTAKGFDCSKNGITQAVQFLLLTSFFSLQSYTSTTIQEYFYSLYSVATSAFVSLSSAPISQYSIQAFSDVIFYLEHGMVWYGISRREKVYQFSRERMYVQWWEQWTMACNNSTFKLLFCPFHFHFIFSSCGAVNN